MKGRGQRYHPKPRLRDPFAQEEISFRDHGTFCSLFTSVRFSILCSIFKRSFDELNVVEIRGYVCVCSHKPWRDNQRPTESERFSYFCCLHWASSQGEANDSETAVVSKHACGKLCRFAKASWYPFVLLSQAMIPCITTYTEVKICSSFIQTYS